MLTLNSSSASLLMSALVACAAIVSCEKQSNLEQKTSRQHPTRITESPHSHNLQAVLPYTVASTWFQSSTTDHLPKDEINSLTDTDRNTLIESLIAAPPGANRSQKLRSLSQGLNVQNLLKFIVRLSQNTDDVKIAEGAIYLRSHELSPDQLIWIKANTSNSKIENAALAAGASRLLHSMPLEKALSSTHYATSLGRENIIESAAAAGKLDELFLVSKTDIVWTSELLFRVAHTLGYTHPEKAIDWIREWSTTKFGSRPTNDFVSSWLVQEPDLASKWVKSLAPGPEKDAGVTAIVNYSINLEDRHGAMMWIQEISDQTMKTELAKRLAGTHVRQTSENPPTD